ncbi:hypothetical protein HDG34_003308 [Paraburkholderia sp. HC6.4b]|uniref:hypothetical protein n=1 Tax=unclassified Paraburkholderia TaxID=2615204 RepID=UPI001616EA45|nr:MULTISPECIES: hypothetical protein [unclassified Paraburkholderia]MBB5409367.1 hypothetical protein [Paraburkholderia sp. HC6.4b]MBB5451096.1 hypothetical protein [Paraburkholderia sp. Kb1A]
MAIYREFDNGWTLAMSDESCTRVVPSVFRFGRMFYGRATIEFWQCGGAEGMRAFAPGETESSVRAFLVELGFIEARRYRTDGDLDLEQVAEVLGLKAAPTGERE